MLRDTVQQQQQHSEKLHVTDCAVGSRSIDVIVYDEDE